MEKILKQEIATVSRDIFNPPMGGILRAQDDTLITRGQGKGLKIYDDIERDCHAFAVLQKRKMAVVAREWHVEPASDRRLDKKAADMIQRQFEAINFDALTLDLLDAILKGYAVAECMYEAVGSEIRLARYIPRDQRRFQFDENFKLRLMTMQNMMPGELMPDRKFIVHTVGSKDGNPYGLGLGTRLFWPVFFKRQDITFWLTFADKFGSPTTVGKYPSNADLPEQNELLLKLQQIAQSTAIAIPANMEVEFLEAARGGSNDFYEKLARYCDEQISEAVLGETSTTTGRSSGMNSNQAEVHNDVRLELVQADADLLSGTLNSTIIKWLTEWNMPGATPPTIWRKVEEEEDLNTRSERDHRIMELGYEPTPEYIEETYGEGWVKKSAPDKTDPATPPVPEFAEGDDLVFPDQVALDAAIDALEANEIEQALMDLLQPVIELINSTPPEQARDLLIEKFPEMDTARLELLLSRAFFVARVWGRLNGD
jgi:phage gp29-like protein